MRDLRQTIADLVEEEPGSIDPGTNLFELGLESIALMKLVNEWRRAGTEVSFATLAAEPTLGAWERLLSHQAEPEAVAQLESVDEGVEFPLGTMQYAYWIGREDGQRLGGVAAHLYTEFDGEDLDPFRLQAAFTKLVARHDMLRAQLTDNGAQVVLPQSPWPGLVVHDNPDLGVIRERLSHQRLDIEAGQVFSAELSRLPGGRTRLHLDIDMVAADAVSYRILLAELARFYLDVGYEPAPVGYSYQRYRLAKSAARPESVRYWQERLATLPGAPVLPSGPGGAPKVARRHFTITAGDRALLVANAQRRGLTPAMVVATAFASVIGRWSATPHFLLNVPLFDREPLHAAVGGVVGDFSSSVMLEIDLRTPATFADRARQVQKQMHTDAAHADHSGVDVLRDLTRRTGRQVFAPVVFTSALGLGELFDPAVEKAFGTPVWIVSQGPQVLLDAQITEVSGGILVNWDTREEQFPAGVLDGMFAAFQEQVDALTGDEAWEEVFGAGESTAEVAQSVVREHVAPRTDLEKVIALEWADVLDVAEVGVTDEFFALGGDSVIATSLVTRLRESLDTTEVSVRMLFSAPTVAGLAEKMLAAEEEQGRLAQVAEIYLEVEALSDEDVVAALEDVDGGR
ncbi:phosphopantetheine-binding protein [Lentzea albidocapillata]|uniref:phosphopantetheine-binding protein n=1 Tax=Lentzea albidocapillata TaxID=40571 RepID=UPI001C40AD6B|nr:phosphopantetheine-binding protein [Lentzea albidocapillata]